MKRVLFILLFSLMLFPVKGFAGNALSNADLEKNTTVIVEQAPDYQDNVVKRAIRVRVILVDPETYQAYAWCDGFLTTTPKGYTIIVLVKCHPM